MSKYLSFKDKDPRDQFGDRKNALLHVVTQNFSFRSL